MKKTLKKYFIPNPGNNHKPHFLRAKAVSLTALVVAVLFAISTAGTYFVSHNSYLASVKAAFLVDLTNKDRAAEGLPKLSINQNLVAAAGMKANDMSSKSYFAHISPDGKNPWYWIKESGYKYVYAGENLAVNFTSSEDVEDAWMESPTHRKNILNTRFTEIGIATASGVYKGDNTVFVVQMFGSPLPGNVTEVRTPTPKPVEPTRPREVVTLSTTAEDNDNVLGEETSVASMEVSPSDTQSAATTVSSDTYVEFANPEITSEDLRLLELQQASSANDEVPAYTSWWERMIVSPSEVVQDLYTAIFALVIFALILKIFIEIRQQHPKNIAYGVALLAVIVFFMHLNSEMATPTIVALM